MSAPLIQGASGLEGEALTYASINENEKDIYTFTANESVSWSLNGGEKSLFEIDKSTGKLSFKSVTDYETIYTLNGKTLKFQTNYSTKSVENSFFVEIYDEKNKNNNSTPITAQNFIQYVSDGSFEKTLIHRSIPNFVIQGGGYELPATNDISGNLIKVPSKGSIINEPGNSNLLGTIAMARISGIPDSATSEWFINLSDNKNLDSQNQGFTVFGHILGDGIKNPLLFNKQKTYDVKYKDGLTLSDLPLANVQDNVVNNNNYFTVHKITVIDKRPNTIANQFNVIVSATDSDGNQSNQYVIVNVQDIQGEMLFGGDAEDTLKGGIGNDSFQGNAGNDIIDGGSDYDIATYSGNFSDYTFTIANQEVTVKDNRSSASDGTDKLSNIEKLTFADKNALVTSKAIKAIHSLGFYSEKVYLGKSDTYKFYNLGSDKYGIGTTNGIDELTGASVLKFDDKNMHLVNDIKATFDQVTGLNDATGQMFRLYNAAFARFPDASGLKYWIGNFSSGKDDSRAVSSSFLASTEFKQRYGDNVSNARYVETLYVNVLGRDYDQAGYNYWLTNLNNNVESRHELLLGFAESVENKGLFSEMTGLY